MGSFVWMGFTMIYGGWVFLRISLLLLFLFPQSVLGFSLYGSSDDTASSVFPSVVTDASTVVLHASRTTTPVITMPSGLVAGNVILCMAGLDTGGASRSITWPAGWTELFEMEDGGHAILGIGWREATGSDSLTLTLNVAEALTAMCYRITDAIDPDTQPPEVSTGATAVNTTPNPDSLSPTGGAKNYLWFAIHSARWTGGQSTTGFPSGYTNTQNITADNNSDGCGIGVGEKQANAASEDPGTFTITTSLTWIAATVAVHPQ